MMGRLIRVLNFLHWPFWAKFTAGFIMAILLPVLVIGFVFQNGFNTLSQQNIENQVREYGRQQQQAIHTALSQSVDILETIATTTEFQEDFARLLADDVGANEDVKAMSTRLQVLLISSQDFNLIRLVRLDGTLVAQASRSNTLSRPGSDVSSPAYIQATNTRIQNQDQSVVVSGSSIANIVAGNNVTNLELIHVIHDQNDQASGFLIATLNQQSTVLQHLNSDLSGYPVYSYLVFSGPDELTMSPPQFTSQVVLSRPTTTAIARALDKQEGVDTYTIGQENNIQVVGYYAPIPDPTNSNAVLAGLVSEVRTDRLAISEQNFLSVGRLFVIGIGLIGLLLMLVLLFNQILTAPLVNLRQAVQSMTQGNFDQPLQMADRADEIGQLRAAFVDMRAHVRHLLDDLETRIATRARDISATQEVSRYAATQRNLQTLMDQVVQLIIEKFPNIYHAQIFLIDAEHQNAYLRASTGQAGQTMLLRGHRLPVGSTSVIGQATAQAKVVHVRDTLSSTVHRRNELLPETRAELAIPLRLGEQIIGALDVQSQTPNAFSEDEVNILQTMADQVSVAIENARLYQESMRRLDDLEKANREATRRVWQDFLYSQRTRQLSSQSGPVTGVDLSALRQRAIEQGKVVIGEVTERGTIPIALPIQLRGQTLGAVEWELAANDLNENKLQLAQELANRLAVSLDNARLFEESQRATERERIVNTIAAKLTPQTEIGEILQTAVREVGQALRAPQVNIRLHHSNGSHPTSHNGN